MSNDPDSAFAPQIIPVVAELRHHPAHNLVAWRPTGILDDLLLDQIGEWLCAAEKESLPFHRFIDFSGLTHLALTTRHVFAFAERRTEQLAGMQRVNSALFSDEWVSFSIARLYEELMADTWINVRAFQDRAKAAAWLVVPVEILSVEASIPGSGAA